MERSDKEEETKKNEKEPREKKRQEMFGCQFQMSLVGIPPYTHQNHSAILTEKEEGSNRRLLRDLPFHGKPT